MPATHRTLPSLQAESKPHAYSIAAPLFHADPAAGQAQAIAVGDVSGDGRDDLVFLAPRYDPNTYESRTQVYVARQDRDGRLESAHKIAETGDFLAY